MSGFGEQQGPLVILIRWAGVLAAIGLTISTPTVTSTIVSVVLAGHALARTLSRGAEPTGQTGLALVVCEWMGTIVAISVTGWWTSPFVFTPLASLVASGFMAGFTVAVPLAVAGAAIVSVGNLAAGRLDHTLAADGSAEMLLAGLVAGYARRVFGQAEERTVTALSQLSQLTEANALLQQLNTLAETLPVSLDLNETVRSTIGQTRTLVHSVATVVFLWDGTLGVWTVAAAEGTRLPVHPAGDRLPPLLRASSASSPPTYGARRLDLSLDGPGLTGIRGAGLYAPLIARSELVGFLVAESPGPTDFDEVDLELFNGLAEQAALAIDNALWFRRLRTLGAEEERARIARDLHDRLAQSLAYLAFELDRVVILATGEELAATLDGLRNDVRQLVTELRDTLYDLRTDVSDTNDLPTTMTEFLARVGDRSSLSVTFENHAAHRLPVPLERELWRISREAVTNVERHAKATNLRVGWTVAGRTAEIVVEDDGVGFPADATRRGDSYGLVGMRERADAIGARLTVDSTPGRGTTIRCRLEAV